MKDEITRVKAEADKAEKDAQDEKKRLEE